ncbi:MAG: 4-(cytidine 5'-diphospho)-2-C-methyl-D-erythritol kinase [Sphingobacteriales bacterium]|nr:4-(cytidine 5'-diphospho)-2-C-methyl-D-erythritol kinase [Sphingobacteriales bacterium]
MLLFPNCKINLGLNILRKREDGFHNLETVFYPVPLTDALEAIQSKNDNQFINFSSSGLLVDCTPEDNLCIKAFNLLKKDFSHLPPIQLHLHKVIPMGAGLGGGSADAAFTLLLLNNKFNLNISEEQLLSYALMLGSDCPFFIINKPAFAAGRGEILEPVTINLSLYDLILIHPGIHINTRWAFSQIKPALPKKPIRTIIQQPINTWKQELVNDFENPVFEKYSVVREIKETLYTNGAVYAAMSGSGSTVYGLFEKTVTPIFNFPDTYFVQKIKL